VGISNPQNKAAPSDNAVETIRHKLKDRLYIIRLVSLCDLEGLNYQVVSSQNIIRLAQICLDKATRLLGEATDDFPTNVIVPNIILFVKCKSQRRDSEEYNRLQTSIKAAEDRIEYLVKVLNRIVKLLIERDL
jgi:hypothetical protein